MAESLWSTASDGAGKIVAVGGSGVIRYSTDGGGTWLNGNSPVAVNLYSVTYGNGKWVAVGANGTVLVSTDATSWLIVTPITAEDLYAVAYLGFFMAVGTNGEFIASFDDGVTWEIRSSGTTEDLFSISAGAGTYIILGANDTVIVGLLSTVELETVVEENVAIAAPLVSGGTFQHDLVAGMEFGSSLGDHHYEYLADGLVAYDESLTGAGLNVVATALIDLLSSSIGAISVNVEDGFEIAELFEWDANKLVEVIESLTFDGIFRYAASERIVETLSVTTTAVPGGSFNLRVSETLTLSELVLAAYLLVATESLTLSDAADSNFERALEIIERLTVSGAASSRWTGTVALSVALAFNDLVHSGYEFSIEENMQYSDTIGGLVAFYITILETATIDAVQDGNFQIITSAIESLQLSSDFFSSGVLREAIADGITFGISFGLGEETYTGWVMNTKNFGVTEYRNYPFNSFAKFGDTYLGASATGLYALEGDNDYGVPIDAWVKTGAIDCGTSLGKIIRECYMAFKSDGSVLLKTVTDDNSERWYKVDDGDEKLHNRRKKLARGLKSGYWEFTLRNVDGSSMEFEQLELVPIYTKRRVNKR